MSANNRDWLTIGRVGAPHGLDGSFHVLEVNAPLLSEGRSVTVAEVDRKIERRAGHAGRVIVRVSGCSDRESAETLRGQAVLMARDSTLKLEQDEWWADDLEGCTVRDGEREVGTVKRLLALPSCEVLQVAREGEAGDLLVPLVSDAVRSVDIKARLIDVDLGFLGEA